MKLHESALLIVSITLAGCGTMPEERAVSGAGIGAATGAIVGAVISLAVGPGALIGALGGGLVGAMTKNGQIKMGEPAWKQGNTGDRTLAPVAEAPATPRRLRRRYWTEKRSPGSRSGSHGWVTTRVRWTA